MKLHGLQKTTLLDFPGRVACTVFLGGCDFRCPYCHNFELAAGAAQPIMDDEEFFSFLKKRTGLLDGVAITGGEPCLRQDLPDFIRKIRVLGFSVKLDTNGGRPALLKSMLEEGLVDYVAMDIKAAPERYALVTGIPNPPMDAVKQSVSLLMNGQTDYEFRTTVVEELHSMADFRAIGPWIQGAKRYFLQPFADRDSVPFSGLHAPSREKLHEYAACMGLYVKNTAIRGLE